jgi:hypothetical protein
MRKLHGASPNRSGAPLHQHGFALDRARDVDGSMRGYARDSKTSTLFHPYVVGQRCHLLHWHDDMLGGSSERTV